MRGEDIEIKPYCEQQIWNCFAYDNGKCKILRRTDFKYECPFFKTREQYEKDIEGISRKRSKYA